MAETTKGPTYYQRGTIQVWDFIRDQRLNFHLGNAIKYICRYGHKGDYNEQLSDLNKAIHYLENERNYLQHSRNREDLPGPTSFFFDGAGTTVSGGLSDIKFEIPSDTQPAAQSNYRGIQGVFGSGRDAVSFEPYNDSGLSEGAS